MTTKLVRDRIPEIMANEGKPAHIHLLDHRELGMALLDKVTEEAAEVVDACKTIKAHRRMGIAMEIADLIEVLRAVAAYEKIPWHYVREVRMERLKERGGFKRGMLLSTHE